MVILAVDTACGMCSAALADLQGKVLAEIEEREASRQAERLVPMVQELLARQKLSYGDLKLLVSTIGPGSFTGLRIGMTAIKGISLVTGAPTMGVNTLEVMASSTAHRPPTTACLLVLLNAMRGQVYAQKFLPGVVPASEPALIDIAEIPAWAEGCSAIAGNCSVILNEVKDLLPPEILRAAQNDLLPHARDAAALAAARLSAGKMQPLDPLYIRKPDAKLPGAA